MNQIACKEYRAKAREALQNHWGTMAGITFLGIIMTSIIFTVVSQIFQSDNESMNTLINFIVQTFITFAFSYGIYYAALRLIRSKDIQIANVFAIFRIQYYTPLVILNLFQQIISFIISFLLYLPLIGVFGFKAIGNLAVGIPNTELVQEVFTTSTISLFILITIVVLILNIIISAVFQLAVWVRLDYPTMSLKKTLSYTWYLIRDRIGRYILLQLSFIGWGILSIFTLFIGLFWLIPYSVTATASFYEVAKAEKGDPL